SDFEFLPCQLSLSAQINPVRFPVPHGRINIWTTSTRCSGQIDVGRGTRRRGETESRFAVWRNGTVVSIHKTIPFGRLGRSLLVDAEATFLKMFTYDCKERIAPARINRGGRDKLRKVYWRCKTQARQCAGWQCCQRQAASLARGSGFSVLSVLSKRGVG